MTDYYRQRLAHAAWTWRECKVCRFHKKPRTKDRPSGRAEKHRARAAERRDIDDQLAQAFHPQDEQWECTAGCCAFYIPGLGLVPKRGSWLY